MTSISMTTDKTASLFAVFCITKTKGINMKIKRKATENDHIEILNITSKNYKTANFSFSITL